MPSPFSPRAGPIGPDESSLHTRPAEPSKVAGEEPLPGYRLIEPLGRGGFGEVWKCEAPGGLHKAIKFVAPDPDHPAGGHALRQEFDALQHVKAIRHPFILQLERVELVEGELVMVMELADAQLQDRYDACAGRGLAGIPRDELLGYFADAAEALDVIGGEHGLQHLDVKAPNLFLIGGHVKVGDYGLVARLGAGKIDISRRGMTPRYVAPEVLDGRIDRRSDQYSLALVYQELLTGTYPYAGTTAPQLMLNHVRSVPNLSGLPGPDRKPVTRALAKNPADRFATCGAFVRALIAASPNPTDSAPGSGLRRTRLAGPGGASDADRTTTLSGLPAVTVPARTSSVLVTPPPRHPSSGVRLDPIFPVVAVDRLLGKSTEPVGYDPEEFVAAVTAVAAGWAAPKDPGAVVRLPDGAWGCRFPTGLPAAVAAIKLTPLIEDGWCTEVTQPNPHHIVLRIRAGGPGRWFGPAAGAEVVVRMPGAERPGVAVVSRGGPLPAGGGPVGEVEVVGDLVGKPDPEFVRRLTDGMPGLLREVRRTLQSVDERRTSRRLAFDGPVIAHPITSDGDVLPALTGVGRDVSAGGVQFVVPAPIPTKYAYVEFGGSGVAEGLAILTRIIRSAPSGTTHVVAGRFRTKL